MGELLPILSQYLEIGTNFEFVDKTSDEDYPYLTYRFVTTEFSKVFAEQLIAAIPSVV